MCVSGGKKCSFFGKFGVLCFLETPVLRFALLPYYRRIVQQPNYFKNLLKLTEAPSNTANLGFLGATYLDTSVVHPNENLKVMSS